MGRKRRHLHHPLAVEDLVGRVFPAPDQMNEVRIFGWWAHAVPNRVRDHARPVRLDHGTLIIHVTSPAWAQELSYLSDDLLKRIRSYVPKAKIRDLRFRVGDLPALPERAAPRNDPVEPIPLSAIPEEIGRALAHVHDDELRDALTRAAAASLANTSEPDD